MSLSPSRSLAVLVSAARGGRRTASLAAISIVTAALGAAATGCDSAPLTAVDAGGVGAFDADAGIASPRRDGPTVFVDVGGPGPPGPPSTCSYQAADIPERPLTISGNDVALRLAAYLWRAPADAALLQRAATLRSSKEVGALALEMQHDPRFADTLRAFAMQWLDMGKVAAAVPRDFAGFDSLLAADMQEAGARFVTSVFRDPNMSWHDLLTSPTMFVNERLTALYGFPLPSPAPAAGAWWTVNGAAQRRAGVSTLGARMTASPGISSRGAWVRSRLLCGEIPPHPPSLPTEPDGATGSDRQRLEAAVTQDPACRICHQFTDPFGFAFGHLDDVGRFRQEDSGVPVDARSMVMLPNSSITVLVDGPVELMAALSDSCQVQRCFVQQWLGYARGGGRADVADETTTALMMGAFIASGKRLDVLPAAVTQTPLFLSP